MINSSDLAIYFKDMFGSLSKFKEALASGEHTLLLHKDDVENMRVRLRWIGEKKGEMSKDVNIALTVNQDNMMTSFENAAIRIANGQFIVEKYVTDETGVKKLYRIAPETHKEQAKRIKVPNFDDDLTFLKENELKEIISIVEAAVVQAHEAEKAPLKASASLEKATEAPAEKLEPHEEESEQAPLSIAENDVEPEAQAVEAPQALDSKQPDKPTPTPAVKKGKKPVEEPQDIE